jgi:hypothetical protein
MRIFAIRISVDSVAAKGIAAKQLSAMDRCKAVMHFMQPGA